MIEFDDKSDTIFSTCEVKKAYQGDYYCQAEYPASIVSKIVASIDPQTHRISQHRIWTYSHENFERGIVSLAQENVFRWKQTTLRLDPQSGSDHAIVFTDSAGQKTLYAHVYGTSHGSFWPHILNTHVPEIALVAGDAGFGGEGFLALYVDASRGKIIDITGPSSFGPVSVASDTIAFVFDKECSALATLKETKLKDISVNSRPLHLLQEPRTVKCNHDMGPKFYPSFSLQLSGVSRDFSAVYFDFIFDSKKVGDFVFRRDTKMLSLETAKPDIVFID